MLNSKTLVHAPLTYPSRGAFFAQTAESSPYLPQTQNDSRAIFVDLLDLPPVWQRELPGQADSRCHLDISNGFDYHKTRVCKGHTKGYTTLGVFLRVTFFCIWKGSEQYLITVNGQTVDKADGLSLAVYLTQSGYSLTRVAVECNGEIIAKTKYDQKFLADGDVLEVVHFVGGG